ncbi:ATP-dependent RNA helicase dbp9 [Termitomyces sp. J132]|nr:ATP-dependent RNA helicase dbp9 [Termitomyces sp. J132]
MAEERLVDGKTTFASFSHLLDARLLRALADGGFARPTLVQAKAIPLALESRDILARARTGSGKTAAYCVPVVQNILSAKSSLPAEDPARQATRALILVPTRELSEQVSAYLRGLLTYCEPDVTLLNVSTGATAHLQRILLSDRPDIVVATPSRALALLQSKALFASSLDSLVIDEADLILSYGHNEDIRQIFSGSFLPKVYQSFLMSATMTEDVELLKGLTLRNPAILRLEEDEDEAAHLSQYAVKVTPQLKASFELTESLWSIDRLFARYHTVQEFNKGVYDYIIATDESGTIEQDTDEEDQADDDEAVEELLSTQRESMPTDDEEPSGELSESPSSSRKRKRASSPKPDPSSSKSRKRKHRKTNDKEYGVTRGVDFVDVACVLNFDLPTTSRSYTHRVGRTARAGRTGMALSFVVPHDQWGKNKVVGCLPSAKGDEGVFVKIEKEQGARGSKIKEYNFDMKQVEAFRYRMEDALRSVTRSAIKEARIKELKVEILNSDKLKASSSSLYLSSSSQLMGDGVDRHTSKTTHWTLSTCGMTSRFTRREFNRT